MEAPFPDDPSPGAPHQRTVDHQDQRRVRGQQRGDDQFQEESAQAEWRPDRAIEHPVITGEVPLLPQTDRSQHGRDGTPAGCQDCTAQQDDGMGKSGAGEDDRKGLQ